MGALRRVRQAAQIRNGALRAVRLMASMQILEHNSLELATLASNIDWSPGVHVSDQHAQGYAEARDHLIQAAILFGWADWQRQEFKEDEVDRLLMDALSEVEAAEFRFHATIATPIPEYPNAS